MLSFEAPLFIFDPYRDKTQISKGGPQMNTSPSKHTLVLC